MRIRPFFLKHPILRAMNLDERVRAQIARFADGFRHAFSVGERTLSPTSEEIGLLQRVADTVVKRGMATPAVVFLESLGPMSYLGRTCVCTRGSARPAYRSSGAP